MYARGCNRNSQSLLNSVYIWHDMQQCITIEEKSNMGIFIAVINTWYNHSRPSLFTDWGRADLKENNFASYSPLFGKASSGHAVPDELLPRVSSVV